MTALLLVFLTVSTTARASSDMSEGSLMARCYAHFTGRKIAQDHPLLIDSITKNNRAVTIENCMKLFDKARLNPQAVAPVAAGYPAGSTLQSDQDLDSLAVLNYFYSYYVQFFEETDFSNVPQTYTGMHNEQWDAAEDALFYVRATFEGSGVDNSSGSYQNGIPYRNILRENLSLTGIRALPRKHVNKDGVCTASSSCVATPTKMHYTVVPRNWYDLPNFNHHDGMGTSGGIGYLKGIKAWPENQATYYGIDGTEFDPSARTGHDASRSRGGGFLGTSSFFVKNAQYADGRSGSSSNPASLSWRSNQDGGIHNRRRMIKNLFDATLCRSQPPLRLDDDVVLERVKNYVDQNFDKSKTIAFRESQLCASCHVAYDEAAAVLRNTAVSTGTTEWDLNDDGDATTTAATFAHSLRVNSALNMPHPNLAHSWNAANWGRSKPTGALHFRDFRGNYITVELPANHPDREPHNRGIQELGEAITETDQFYACFAKRMFFLFTGIDVSLEDHGDSRLPPLTQEEKFYRDQYVVPLAIGAGDKDGLKQHQSVRRLIKDILELDIYQSRNLRAKFK